MQSRKCNTCLGARKEKRQLCKEERNRQKNPSYPCRHCKETFRSYRHKIISKTGTGICNFCIFHYLDLKIDLDEREKTYIDEVYLKRKRSLTINLEKFYPCS